MLKSWPSSTSNAFFIFPARVYSNRWNGPGFPAGPCGSEWRTSAEVGCDFYASSRGRSCSCSYRFAEPATSYDRNQAVHTGGRRQGAVSWGGLPGPRRSTSSPSVAPMIHSQWGLECCCCHLDRPCPWPVPFLASRDWCIDLTASSPVESQWSATPSRGSPCIWKLVLRSLCFLGKRERLTRLLSARPLLRIHRSLRFGQAR